MRQLDLFPELKPPRKPRRVMMHSVDQGNGGGHFTCKKCGHDSGWKFDLTKAQIDRGLTCPNCNEAPKTPRA